MIKRVFTEHPASVGESYFQHMGMAFGFGAKMVMAGGACLLHGLFPFLFKTTGKRCIEELHTRMVTHRNRHAHMSAAKDSQAMPAMMRDPARIKAAE